MSWNVARTEVLLMRAALLAVMAGSLGCMGTAMSARRARSPVLVGPVACIGCPASAPAPGAPIKDNASRWVMSMYLAGTSSTSSGGNIPAIDMKTEGALPDPCRGDVRLSKVHASSFGIDTVFLMSSSAAIEIEAAAAPVPSGSCGARPWPYAGPQGIVFFDAVPPAPPSLGTIAVPTAPSPLAAPAASLAPSPTTPVVTTTGGP